MTQKGKREMTPAHPAPPGTMELAHKISLADLPKPMGLPVFHIRHFPSIVRGAPPSVLELVRLGVANLRFSEDIWAGNGTLTFFPSEIEEHMTLVPREIIGAYHFGLGYSFPGGEVLYKWV